jgi:putative flippase GtrA
MSRFFQMRLIGPILHHRFTKFGIVGFSGTIVNLVVLYLCQEYILKGIRPAETRLNLSLAVAIFLATINNFLWNRRWTWRDRKETAKHGLWIQMGQYFLASWLSILLQFILTKIGAYVIHYMAANIMAIATAAIVTYVLNDVWTFDVKRDRGVRR